jgi:hypothetical protein
MDLHGKNFSKAGQFGVRIVASEDFFRLSLSETIPSRIRALNRGGS